MKLHFYKYEGCGNDFILFDNRKKDINLSTQQIKQLCDRHFGIGADGLMLLEKTEGYDFKMVYYNSDGNQSSMCGNGGRCITAFAQRLGIIKNKAHFMAIDGEHISVIDNETISLKMNDVPKIETHSDYYFLNTGSPHVVKWVKNIATYNVFEEGKKIRYSEPFNSNGGTNVNFVELKNGKLYIRTYERGVENETLACGTGVTAAALVEAITDKPTHTNFCDVVSMGGNLSVTYKKQADNFFTDIWLKGPALFVFEGDYIVK
ncbi:MAG TPA: diaminopimelate epimerase [Bacteroidia bacterium]|jgi:diaminopimelate epimerase|nr:diaminopimelate epimerase [Bacteroidia bacterium]